MNNEQGYLHISNVLICGNTKLLEEENIRQISRLYNVTVTGELSFEEFSSKKVHFYDVDPSTERFNQLCNAFSPEAIWYISGYCDGGEGLPQEVNIINGLMKAAKSCDVHELIVLSSINAIDYLAFEAKTPGKIKSLDSRCVCCAQNEKLLKYLANKYDIKLILVRAPYIGRDVNDDNYIGSLFNSLEAGNTIKFTNSKSQYVDFVSMRNVVDIFIAATEENAVRACEYTVYSGFSHTQEELAGQMQKLSAGLNVEYGPNKSFYDAPIMESAGRSLRKNLGFVATDDIFSNIDKLYEEYISRSKKKKTILDKLKEYIEGGQSLALKIIELVLFFIIAQLLLTYTADSVYFRYVDVRLFYIVIIAITHGMGMGIIAGVLECLSLFYGYSEIGVTGTMLFYNVDYWLPFVIYLLTGSMIGYVKNTYQQKNNFTEEENAVLQDKYSFLNTVYQQVIDNKGEYKRQILGYQDSFGKIFEAVEDLDGTVESEIFMNGVEILERILSNNSVAIYTLDDTQEHMRLVACSKEMSFRLLKSIRVEDHQIIYNAISTGETWKNTEFLDGVPMYAFGINRNDKVRVMITLLEADNSQMGLYYSNLFSILCNLIRVSFDRAYEYQLAIEDEKYLENTTILKSEYFNEILEVQDKMEEAGMASYALIRFVSQDLEMINSKIFRLIRQSDDVGMGEDGNVRLILTQVTTENLAKITKRLENNGFEFVIERD